MCWWVEPLFQHTQTTSTIYTNRRFPFSFFEPTSFNTAIKCHYYYYFWSLLSADSVLSNHRYQWRVHRGFGGRGLNWNTGWTLIGVQIFSFHGEMRINWSNRTPLNEFEPPVQNPGPAPGYTCNCHNFKNIFVLNKFWKEYTEAILKH